MRIKLLLGVLGVCLLWLPRGAVYAYSTDTHAYLTEEIIDFYDQSFPERKLSAEIKPHVISGARSEDDAPRYLNHFYDPIKQRGLSSDGAINPLAPLGTWNTAKDWAMKDELQRVALYQAAQGVVSLIRPAEAAGSADFSWSAGVEAYARGDMEQAAKILGHMLHLIEDMGVPEHTRNDPHAFGCPYEDWASRFIPGHPDLSLRSKLGSPFIFYKLQDYFDELAIYTNKHFYSFHTIGIQSGYGEPVPLGAIPTKEGAYAVDEDGRRLFFTRANEGLLLKTGATLDNDLVMQDYWDQLSPRVVRYGAGLVRLFIEEGEAMKLIGVDNKEAEGSFMSSIFDTMVRLLPSKNKVATKSNLSFFAPFEVLAPKSTSQFPIPKTQVAKKTNTVQSAASVEPKAEIIETAEPPLEKKLEGSIVPLPAISFLPAVISGSTAIQSLSLPEDASSVSSTPDQVIEPTSGQAILTVSLSANLSSSSIFFSWELSSSSDILSTLEDITNGSSTVLYEDLGRSFEMPLLDDGLSHLFLLTVFDGENKAQASTTVQMPEPLPPPGPQQIVLTTSPLEHGIVFKAKVNGLRPTEKVRLEIEIQSNPDQFTGTVNYASDFVPAGSTSSISIIAFKESHFFWRARIAYEGGGFTDWLAVEEASISMELPGPILTGSFSNASFPNGYCGFGKEAVTASRDGILSSVEFYASCVNGSCGPQNNFQVYDGNGDLIAESDGPSNFGYSEAQWQWQMFKGVNQARLRAGAMYFVTPKSHNGTCMVERAHNNFYLR